MVYIYLYVELNEFFEFGGGSKGPEECRKDLVIKVNIILGFWYVQVDWKFLTINLKNFENFKEKIECVRWSEP